MRSLTKKTFLSMILLIPALLVSSQASAAGRAAFINWASGESREIDTRWERITKGRRLEPVVIRSGYNRRARYRAGSVSRPDWKGSASACNAAGFTGSGSGRIFPRASRKRSGPTRGSSSFTNPASMNHGLSYSVRRPGGSSAHRRNSVSQRGAISRPRLKSFGRISSSSRRSTIGTKLNPFSGRRRRRR
ncbi:MAG: hypothetical protein R6U43_10010 [Candidatus Krumholzibacteriales bacterium]